MQPQANDQGMVIERLRQIGVALPHIHLPVQQQLAGPGRDRLVLAAPWRIRRRVGRPGSLQHDLAVRNQPYRREQQVDRQQPVAKEFLAHAFDDLQCRIKVGRTRQGLTQGRTCGKGQAHGAGNRRRRLSLTHS